MRVEEETKRFEMKILEIESEFTDPEERASKIEKANRKHEKHLKRIQEKLEEKLEELQEDFQNGDLQEEEEGDFQEQKNG